MALQTKDLHVILTPGGFYPQAVRCQGRTLRVLHVEKVQTRGFERRYRVRTREGRYDLGLHMGTGAWQVHRRPGWLDRARAYLERMPRYPLPAWRRRARPPARATQAKATSVAAGGDYAGRLALVRQ